MFKQASGCSFALRGAALLAAQTALGAQAAACPASVAQLTAMVESAEDAFAANDAIGFTTALDATHEALRCLNSAPPPSLVAVVHEVEALKAYLQRDQGRAMAALRAMRDADQDAQIPEDLAPAGGELQAWWALASTLPTLDYAPVALAPGLRLVVDGRPGDARPVDHLTVLVVLDAQGAVRWSDLLAPGDPIPAELLAGAALPPPPPRRLRAPLLISAGGVALVSGGLWAGALLGKGHLQDAGDRIASNDANVGVADGAAWQSAVKRTNTLGVAGQATAGLAVGLGVLGLAVPW